MSDIGMNLKFRSTDRVFTKPNSEEDALPNATLHDIEPEPSAPDFDEPTSPEKEPVDSGDLSFLEEDDGTPVISFHELKKLNLDVELEAVEETVQVRDLRVGDWILDADNNWQPLWGLLPIHYPKSMLAIEMIDGAQGNFGGTHLVSYRLAHDTLMFHQRLRFSRRALKQLSRRSIDELEYVARLEEDPKKPYFVAANDFFQVIACHTWHNLPVDGSGDHDGIMALRVVFARTTLAVGHMTEDNEEYEDLIKFYFPELAEAEEETGSDGLQELVFRCRAKLLARQLLLLLDTRKYAKEFTGKSLPWWWWANPGHYNYGGIEIGRVESLEKLAERLEMNPNLEVELPD